MKKTVSIEVTAVLLVVVMMITLGGSWLYFTGRDKQTAEELARLKEKYGKLELLETIVDEYYVGEYDKNTIMEEAARGFINGIGDEWSDYYTAEEYETITQSMDDSYSGIGVAVSNDNGTYRITRVFYDSPAEEAGVKPFDVITSVNGIPSEEYASFDALASDIRGENGSEVKLGVLRDGEELVLSIKRGKVYEITVDYTMLDNSIGYIVISTFHENSAKEFIEAVDMLMADGAKGLIFDVRMNNGGYVDIMAEMLDVLLPEGPIIYLSDKNEKVVQTLTSDPECIDIPMAVLTNYYSISSAEFFAAALQEYGVAEIVGDATAGKGYAQKMITLSDGSSVNLSLYKYYTPNGKSLKDTGIVPDHQISLTDDEFYNFYYLTNEEDRQLMKAVEVLNAQID